MLNWTLSRNFDGDGASIRWDHSGTGRPLVLLHGTPSWSFMWRKVVPLLALHYSVLVFDWPGYGLSDRGDGVNINWDEQSRRLRSLFQYWGLSRPAVVAHDIAPILVLRAHLLDGLPVGPLVLTDAGLVPPFVSSFSRHVREHLGAFRGLPEHIAEAMIETHMRTAVHRPMDQGVLDGYMFPWRGRDGVAAHWHAVAGYDETLAQPVVDRLHHLGGPTLVLWGADDAWEPRWKAEELAALVPGSEIRLLPEAGHFAAEDEPEAFAESVREFLDRVDYR